MKKLRIGLLGLGEIGSGVYSILTQKKDYLAKEIGVVCEFAKVAVRNRSKKRKARVPSSLITTDPMSVVEDPSVDVVVELIGGTKASYQLVTKALASGKHVVTANKALLAEKGDEIFKLAAKMKKWVFFEASVGGGIPIVKTLREGLVANELTSLFAIINGTSNYILTKMTSEGTDFKEALKKAQEKGYAESDPTLDLNGMDAAHKLAILIRFGFRGKVNLEDIYTEGIQRISSEDIAFANEFGYRIKLLAIAKKTPGGIDARVQPTLLPKEHILANVNGSFNAVLMHGDRVGDILLYGRGAGSYPTASAVVSDLVDIAKRYNRLEEDNLITMAASRRRLAIRGISSVLSRYYLRLHVIDRPGVLARIFQVLGSYQVSVSDCMQQERRKGSAVPLIILTHDVSENAIRKAVHVIDRLSIVSGRTQVLRLEENGGE